MPASKHICPVSAPCESPSTPAISIPSGKSPSTVVRPKRASQGRASGSIDRGTVKRASSSSSQSSVWMLKSIVREAFV